MIETLQGFPDNVTAFALHGRLTQADYQTVLIPDVKDKLSRHEKLRAYTEVAHDFAGVDPEAMWEDAKFGFGHLLDWERAALVTDVEWMSRATRFFALLIPGQWRTFPIAEAAQAREWIAEPT